ncbi:PAS domain-containing protein [Croceibacterium mercuriale]|nr:PAS domain-containing protein [Croceibacterium mercuriale]
MAGMLAAVRSELGADGLQVIWYNAPGDGVVLFAAGIEHADLSDWVGMSDLAIKLAEFPATGSRVREGACPRGCLMTLAIPLSEGIVTVTGMFLRANEAARRASTQTLLRLESFLRPFLELWAVTRASSAHHAGLAAAIDHCDVATLILDRRGGVIFANSACEAMLRSKDGIAVRGGKLCGSTLSDTLRVQAAIEHVLGSPDAGQARPIVAMRRAKRRPLMATIMPAFTAEDEIRAEVVVAYLFDPEQDLTVLVEPACRYYGLSTSETRLTCRLAAGDSLAEAAVSLGVREQTARSCLKQIFLKTETNRQAELVSLMVKSAVRVTGVGKVQVF